VRLRLALSSLVVAVCASGVASAAPTAAFTPKLLAGTWRGTWTNQTFGSTGPASIVAKAPQNKRLLFTTDFGGNVFGCPDPPPESGGITRGQGLNRWNARGFVVSRRSASFGTMRITYNHARRTLVGNGANPKCAGGLKWALSGRFSGRTFSGTLNITLPDGSKAVSVLSLRR
jgi:hypothetical protein